MSGARPSKRTPARRTIARWGVFLTAVAVVGAFGAGIGQGVAQAAPVAPPVVRVLRLDRHLLPATGGVVSLSVRTDRASSCHLELLSIPHLAVRFRRQASICNGGYAITIGPNRHEVAIDLVFRYLAEGEGAAAARRLVIKVAAAPAPPAPSATAPTRAPATSSPAPPASTFAGVPAPAASPVLLDVAPASQPASGFQESDNWSGYLLPAPGGISYVGGQWVVPRLDCQATPNGAESTWVGLGGAGNSAGASTGSLLQTGTDDQCVGGLQQESAWWELYPSAPNAAQYFVGLTVQPGNTMRAQVYQAASGQWVTELENLSSGVSGVMVSGGSWGVLDPSGNFDEQGNASGLSYSGATSAEWIVEDYQLNQVQVPFADYGTVSFSNLATSLETWTLDAGEGQAIVQNGATISTPGLPARSGFSVTFTG
ncbi:MAG: G1 family endopeptidase [Actinomycetota bacterium]|nr:G1 family endopeptidase [Actinomycetota bacterium]